MKFSMLEVGQHELILIRSVGLYVLHPSTQACTTQDNWTAISIHNLLSFYPQDTV